MFTTIPPIHSYPMTTVVSLTLSPKSKINREFKPLDDTLNRGCTGWNTTGTVKKDKVTLEYND